MAKSPVGYRSPFRKASPMRFAWAPALIAAAPGIIGAVGSLFGRKARRREQAAARKEMEAAKKAYMNMEFKNPFAGMENPYQENLYEDLTVNRQGADYLREQQQQSQANIMQGLKGVAGGSGVAGLAQSMANVSSQQARQASVQIAQQERQNELYRAKGEQTRRTSSLGFDKMMRTAQYQAVDLREQQRTENLYGLGLDRLSAADKARSTARSQFISGLGQAIGGAAGTFMPGGANYGYFGKGQSAGSGGPDPNRYGYGYNKLHEPSTELPSPGENLGEITTPGSQGTDYNYGFGTQNSIPTGYDAYGNPIFG